MAGWSEARAEQAHQQEEEEKFRSFSMRFRMVAFLVPRAKIPLSSNLFFGQPPLHYAHEE